MIHGILPWGVLGLAAWMLFRVYWGWLSRRSWTPLDRKATSYFPIAIDMQVLVGILLTVTSPISQVAFGDITKALTVEPIRFFIFEHIPIMTIALVMAHIGSAQVKKVEEGRPRFQRAALWYTLSTAALLLGIPWWRPLLRLAG
jgi:hypothetical protein